MFWVFCFPFPTSTPFALVSKLLTDHWRDFPSVETGATRVTGCEFVVVVRAVLAAPKTEAVPVPLEPAPSLAASKVSILVVFAKSAK